MKNNFKDYTFYPLIQDRTNFIKSVENFKEIYNRFLSKHGIKMKAFIAIQRKLIEQTYILFKNNTKYNKEFESIKREQPEMAAAL